MWLGTYERDYARTRVLVSGMHELGVDVVECHRPLWELTRHKAGSFLSPRQLPASAARFAAAWVALSRAERHVPHVDAVVAGYPAQPDAPFVAHVARRRGVPFVVDAMISLADTLSGDRARVGSRVGTLLERVDRVAVRRADLVMTDTSAQAEWFADRFTVASERLVVVPVGAEPDLFRYVPSHDGPVHALFYGKLSPLHGLDVIVDAARQPGVPPIRLIGDGQLGPWLDGELARIPADTIERESWVPYESLGVELASCAICLGIFGTSDKARRVVPNKVFQAMAVGRAIVTADTAAAREVLTDGEHALLVPPGDANALAEALRVLTADAALRVRLGDAAYRRFLEVGTPRAVARRFVDALITPANGGLAR